MLKPTLNPISCVAQKWNDPKKGLFVVVWLWLVCCLVEPLTGYWSQIFHDVPLFGMMIPTDRWKFPDPKSSQIRSFLVLKPVVFGDPPPFFRTPEMLERVERVETTNHLTMIPEGCIALWMTLRHHLSFFPSDPAFMLVMCLECCTPTAYQLVSCLSWKGKVHWMGAGRCQIYVYLGRFPCFTNRAKPSVRNVLSICLCVRNSLSGHLWLKSSEWYWPRDRQTSTITQLVLLTVAKH